MDHRHRVRAVTRMAWVTGLASGCVRRRRASPVDPRHHPDRVARSSRLTGLASGRARRAFHQEGRHSQEEACLGVHVQLDEGGRQDAGVGHQGRQRLGQEARLEAPVIGDLTTTERMAETVVNTPCREWHGGRFPNGYGKRYLRGSRPYRTVLVHRWMWEQAYGPIPAGLYVMHLCDNPPCYRLDHLRLGTQFDNMRDMHAKGRGRRDYSRVTACKEGHPYPENARYDSHGWPHCRVCDTLRHRIYRSLDTSS